MIDSNMFIYVIWLLFFINLILFTLSNKCNNKEMILLTIIVIIYF